jgi:hypothetical protein
VNGRVIVREGQLNSVDINKLIEKHNNFSIELAKISYS